MAREESRPPARALSGVITQTHKSSASGSRGGLLHRLAAPCAIRTRRLRTRRLRTRRRKAWHLSKGRSGSLSAGCMSRRTRIGGLAGRSARTGRPYRITSRSPKIRGIGRPYRAEARKLALRADCRSRPGSPAFPIRPPQRQHQDRTSAGFHEQSPAGQGWTIAPGGRYGTPFSHYCPSSPRCCPRATPLGRILQDEDVQIPGPGHAASS